MQKYNIIKINKEKKIEVKEFLEVPLLIYGNKPDTWNSIAKTESLLKIKDNYDLYIAVDSSKKKNKIIGRMTIGFNTEITDPNGVPYGHIGLFEVIEDFNAFAAMINFARSALKVYHSILFPFFISTWYNYRFTIADESTFNFFLEPSGKKYYKEFIEKMGIKKIYHYKSYITHNVEGFMKKNKKRYEEAINMGYTFRKLNKKKLRDELKVLYELSIEIFDMNPFYSHISFENFCILNESSLKLVDSDFFTFVEKDNKPVAFSFAIPDYTEILKDKKINTLWGKLRFLLDKKKTKGYIYKTLGVLPNNRRLGLHEAMSYVIALSALERKYTYFIAALVYEANPSSATLIDTEETTYEVYEI